LTDEYTVVEQRAVIVSEYAMPYETNLPVCVCFGLKITVDTAWVHRNIYDAETGSLQQRIGGNPSLTFRSSFPIPRTGFRFRDIVVGSREGIFCGSTSSMTGGPPDNPPVNQE